MIGKTRLHNNIDPETPPETEYEYWSMYEQTDRPVWRLSRRFMISAIVGIAISWGLVYAAISAFF